MRSQHCVCWQKISFESIFEKISLVHQHLSDDEVYDNMDFDSRDYYRRCIVGIARQTKASEPAIAKKAIQMAQQSGMHVGHYIAGDRQSELIAAFGKLPFKYKAVHFAQRHMLLLYVGGTLISTLVSAGILCISLFYMYPVVYGIIGFFISLIPIYTVAIAVNNRIMSLLDKPAFIPKMALKDGIPKKWATMVVIPSLVTCIEDGRELLEKMQVDYAANQQDNLYFTLLSDFKDEKTEMTEQDTKIIETIAQEIQAPESEILKKSFFLFAEKKNVYTRKK